MLNLHARFIAICNSDKELARSYVEANENNIEMYSENNNEHELNKIDGQSVGHSVGSKSSGTSKEQKMIRQKRQMLEERLNAPFKSLLFLSSLVYTIFVILLAVAAVFGEIAIMNIESGTHILFVFFIPHFRSYNICK